MSTPAAAHRKFLEARRSYLGGTDIGAVLGIAPPSWGSPLSVYMDKVEAEKVEDADSLPMRRGLALERFIADEFERARPGHVCYHPAPVVRTDWGFPAGASVDRYVARAAKPRTPVALMDCKAAFSFVSARQWRPDDLDLPDHYYTQLQWYLAVTGLPLAYGAADTGGNELSIVPIEPDERVQRRLIEAGRAFWCDHVEARVPPEPQGTPADGRALAELYGASDAEPLVYLEGGEAEVLLSDFLAHKAKEREHKDAAEEAKQKLCALMGAHERAMVGRWRLSWAPQTRVTIDAKLLRAEAPDVYERYAKTHTSRVFATPKEISE